MGKSTRRGRPREMEEPLNMGIVLDKKICERLDRLADKIGISRAQLIRNLVGIGLEETEKLESIGFLSVVMFVQEMKKKFHERGERVRENMKAGAAEPATA